MDMTASHVKEIAQGLGADLCGIASVDRFSGAPAGAHPRDTLPECRSVIVVAKRFLNGTTRCDSTIPYTIVRNLLSGIMDRLTFDLSYELERLGFTGVPTGAIGPTNADPLTGRFMGLISLKHAAELAGLGRIGKNTLLVNDRFGNMIWLGAVITDAPLEPDPLAVYEACHEGCEACINACPVKALGDSKMNQIACWQHAFGAHLGGEWRIKCHQCRTVCPNSRGL
jgi:epoxyqueuosine reductase